MMRLWRAFFYSLDGFKAAWKNEAAFRLEIVLVIAAVIAAFMLAPDRITFALMVASAAFVIVIELINTAIEATIDRHGEEHHPMAKIAKDCGSAAVLTSALIAAFIWWMCLR